MANKKRKKMAIAEKNCDCTRTLDEQSLLVEMIEFDMQKNAVTLNYDFGCCMVTLELLEGCWLSASDD